MAADPQQTGCQETPAGYLCSFQVSADYENAPPDGTIEGSVSATAAEPGSAPETQTASFSLPASGTGTTGGSVSMFFTFDPCSESSTATAETVQPNQVDAQPAPFGRICAPPPTPTPLP
jgi:hypothetical protein